MQITTPLQGALAMAARGYRVFRLQPNSRFPLPNDSWTETATTDPATIREWWTCPVTGAELDYNFAVSTTGHIVVDVDCKNGVDGTQALKRYPELESADTLAQVTPSGGFHLFFTGPNVACSIGALGAGLDVRSFHGYVVGPGSRIDGKSYEIVRDTAPAPLPAAVLSRLKAPTERMAGTIIGDLDTAEATARAEDLLQRAAPAIEGAGGEAATFALACRVKDFGLSEPTTLALMLEHWNDRCVPPWRPEHLAVKVSNAYQYGKNAVGSASPAADFGDLIDPSAPPPASSAPAKPETPPAAPFDLDFDEASIPPRQWVMDGVLLRGHLTSLVAPGSAGKSSLTLAWALALARGDGGFIRTSVREPARVLMYNAEDDFDELRRRSKALTKYFELDPTATKGNLHVWHKSMRLVDRNNKNIFVTAHFKMAAEYMRDNKIDVLMLDPIVETHRAEENNNGEMAFVMQTFRELARRANAAVLLVHHSRKPPAADSSGYAGNMDSGRGASSLVSGVRLSFTLYPMHGKEAEAFGVPEADRARYSRLDTSKVNYVGKSGRPRWFESHTVPLLNGDDAHVMRPVDLEEVDFPEATEEEKPRRRKKNKR